MSAAAQQDTGISVPLEFSYEGAATLYIKSEFTGAYRRAEVRSVYAKLCKYAQYGSALEFTFLRPRERRRKEVVEFIFPSLVIVRGWGHPDLAAWDRVGLSRDSGVRMMKYPSHDSRWSEDLTALLAAAKAEVLVDYRGHDTRSKLP